MEFILAGRTVAFELDYSSEHQKEYSKRWFQASDKSWHSVDLGPETDTRTATIRVRNTNEEILELEDFLLNKDSGITQKLEVSFGEGEEVFGCELDYSTNLFIYVVSSPRYKYLDLDFGSLEFKIMLDKETEPALLPLPSGHSWDSMPWSFPVDRENLENFDAVVPYVGETFVGFDEARAKIVKASFLLDRDQCTWLKRTLYNLRISEAEIDQTYFKALGLNGGKAVGGGYDTGALYSLSDGADLKENYTVPASSVEFEGKKFSITSAFDTGVPNSDIFYGGGSGPSTMALKFKISSNPSTNIQFCDSEGGTPFLVYLNTSGEIRLVAGGSDNAVTTWSPIHGQAGGTKTTAELLSYSDYNTLAIIPASSGYNVYFNGYSSNLSGAFAGTVSGDWEIKGIGPLISPTLELFNVAFWNYRLSTAELLAYLSAPMASDFVECFKVRDYQEQREAVNLYRVEMELLVDG